MKNVFKTGFGFHVDLDAIVTISELQITDMGGRFTIDIQLLDKPKEVECYARWNAGEAQYKPMPYKYENGDKIEYTDEFYQKCVREYEAYKSRVQSDWDALYNAWKNS